MHPFDADLERERRHDAEETHLHTFQKADRLAEKGGGWAEYDRRLAELQREADVLAVEVAEAVRRAA